MELGSEILIIGGGMHGTSAAFHLASRGISVRVIEKDYVARHASGVNAGGVRTLGRHTSELPLSLLSKKIWLNIEEVIGDDCGFRPVGGIRLIENETDLAKAKARETEVKALKLDHAETVIDQQSLFNLLPAVSRHCLGALWVQGDGYANPYRSVVAFRRAAQRLGAIFEEGKAVSTINFSGDAWSVKTADGSSYRAQVILNCSGAWGARTAAMLGDNAPLKPNGSMMIITNRMPLSVGPVVGAMSRSLSFKQFPNGTVLLGGGHRAPVDLDNNLSKVTPLALGKASRTALEIFPFMKDAHAVRFWSGIEGFMPDGLPVIGPSVNSPAAFHAFGFSAHGFQLGPAAGKVMADLASGNKPEISLEAFKINRAYTESVIGSH